MEIGPIVSEVIAPPLEGIHLAVNVHKDGLARFEMDAVINANVGRHHQGT